jgi:hypothetical protein
MSQIDQISLGGRKTPPFVFFFALIHYTRQKRIFLPKICRDTNLRQRLQGPTRIVKKGGYSDPTAPSCIPLWLHCPKTGL